MTSPIEEFTGPQFHWVVLEDGAGRRDSGRMITALYDAMKAQLIQDLIAEGYIAAKVEEPVPPIIEDPGPAPIDESDPGSVE